MTEQCHSVLHTPTRPSLDEQCTFTEGHFGPHSFDELFEDVEEAELEDTDIDEETWANRHWLLIVGVGLVGIGLLVRWWLRRR